MILVQNEVENWVENYRYRFEYFDEIRSLRVYFTADNIARTSFQRNPEDLNQKVVGRVE